MTLLSKWLLCIIFFGGLLYQVVHQHNALTELRIRIPQLHRELKALEEVSCQLQYEVECFESPAHLFELSRDPRFGHLKYPSTCVILSMASL